MSEKINRIFRKFLIVAVCLVVAGRREHKK